MVTQTAYRVIARNRRTGVRIERQVLDGTVLTDEDEAWRLAVAFAEQQQNRTRDQWAAVVESYVTER
jgi:hypothetical protein